jgi:hypothetical protein
MGAIDKILIPSGCKQPMSAPSEITAQAAAASALIIHV